jgi:hypothetical protein
MSKREWFRATIRWGVMVEGKEGLWKLTPLMEIRPTTRIPTTA